MTEHRDALEDLNEHLPLQEKLLAAHRAVQTCCSEIARIAVAIYDPETAVLKTFLHSSGNDNPLPHYQALLDDAPSLKAILQARQPRVINNLVTFEDSDHEHTQRIGRAGYAASYTLPMFDDGRFIGFIFFNSKTVDVFSEKILNELDLYGHLIALMVINELGRIQTLSAAIRTTSEITHLRDPETGSHLDRMSRYSLLIARNLADKYQLDDEYIQHIFMFAPLHDIGKVAIPDEVLLKPGPLNDEEWAVMRSHASRGREMVDSLVDNFGLGDVQHIDVLRNIALLHHEALNGSGYPEGRTADNIPLEARIVAVADVFDALTSERPYKKAWSNERAIAQLREWAGEKLDLDCVEALLRDLDEVVHIQERFQESYYG